MTAGANVTAYEYDIYWNMTKLTDPMGYAETCTYDLLGRMLTKTDRKGTIFAYAYDGLGRLLNTKNGATVLEEYTYTLIGGKRTENNSAVQTTNTYDSLGRLSAAADKNVATGVITTKTYGYDIGSNRTSAVITVGSVTTNSTTYTYDAMNRMKTALEGGVLQCTYNYDANGNRSSLAYANGVTTEYTYNLANMVKTLANKSGAAVLSSYTYAYQLDGNQVSKTDQAGKVTTYVYDGLGRLTSEIEKTGATVTFSLAYAYDANNNRVSMTNNGAVTTYVYDKNNRLTTETAAGVTSTYAYDNNGNTLTKTKSGAVAETYTYDLLNRMVSSSVNGVAAAYKYRADGLRYSKTVSGVETAHIWDGSNIVGDVAGSTVTATYVRGIGLIASKAGGVFTYYLFNGHGDVVQLANNAGAVTKVYDYDAFGNEKNIVATDANVFRYCAEYFDKETGTVYLQHRYYNPRTGRFNTQDPAGDGLNWYTYCYGNPIFYTDSSGMKPRARGATKAAWEAYYNDYQQSCYPNGAAELLTYVLTVRGDLDNFYKASLGAVPDLNGVYHISQTWWQSIPLVGFNGFYDYVFGATTSMTSTQFPFMYGDTRITFWAWKGNYMNLGAGAELGIYSGGVGGHYFTGTEYAMPMTLRLLDRHGNEIFYWDPGVDNWWITGFYPAMINVDAQYVTASYSLDFSGNTDLFWAFYNAWNGNPNEDGYRWIFSTYSYSASLVFSTVNSEPKVTPEVVYG